MNTNVLLALVMGGLLVASGYYLKETSSSPPRSNPTNNYTNTCGSNGCGGNSMMHNIEITNEKTFIQEMIPHHQEAINTSKIVLSQTQDPELKKFTQDVVDVQTAEVNQMKEWLKNWFNEDYVGNSDYMPMMSDLSKYEGQNLEKIYAEGMVRHHQGAIEMARKVIELNPRPEIKKMANNIISAQQAEVKTLENWLSTKYQGVTAKDGMNHMMNIH